MKVRPGPLTLQAAYWGEERNKHFVIKIDGTTIATQRLDAERPGEFFTVDYPVPEALTKDRADVLMRFEPVAGPNRCGPVFGVRLFTDKPASATPHTVS
jgi:hypothetical protein